MDPKQVLGAFLTMSMFVMLANMIKKEHFDSAMVELPESTITNPSGFKVKERVGRRINEWPWKEDGPKLNPCWTRPAPKANSKGFVTFSLTNGPEYHVSQIADAVVVARYLGATLVLPDIKGRNFGEIRRFQEMYDAEKFVKGLDGVVKVVKDHPEISTGKFAVIRVPNRVTEEHIAEHIEPIFRKKHNLRLVTSFSKIDMEKKKERNDSDSVACLAMYSTLELQPEFHEVVDSMVERLRILSQKSNGKFIAVDLRIDIMDKNRCQNLSGTERKSCYNPQEIGEFLNSVGFDRDIPIYLTQFRWHRSLDALKNIFQQTYTKEGIMPADKKKKFLNSVNSNLEKAMDFYICSQSDIFVPAMSGIFYTNVAGNRIASGRTQILIPTEAPNSTSSTDIISPYVTKQNHMAYSCFC